jgi:hypothetical protein
VLFFSSLIKETGRGEGQFDVPSRLLFSLSKPVNGFHWHLVLGGRGNRLSNQNVLFYRKLESKFVRLLRNGPALKISSYVAPKVYFINT